MQADVKRWVWDSCAVRDLGLGSAAVYSATKKLSAQTAKAKRRIRHCRVTVIEPDQLSSDSSRENYGRVPQKLAGNCYGI